MNDVTLILCAVERGDTRASEQLLPLIYDELRKLAALRLAQEKPGQTLQATALVHEAYLRLVDDQPSRRWNSRGHFFGAAAEAMRRILVENARKKRRAKHGGDRRRVDLDEAVPVIDTPVDVLALDEALDKLAREEPIKAELVKLRYFAGLSLEETAACLGISAATAKRHWAVARAWPSAALSDDETGDTSPE
jgi:RNA polymerase sigma factor (TIGR02999 family)